MAPRHLARIGEIDNGLSEAIWDSAPVVNKPTIHCEAMQHSKQRIGIGYFDYRQPWNLEGQFLILVPLHVTVTGEMRSLT